ncbi:hypothetical protein RI367_001104 [Sorochytrium milnesiophthora]
MSISHSQLVDTLLDFLEAAIHGILYVRDLYPAHIFERVQKYGVSTMMCRSPAVIDYVRNVLASCRPEIEQSLIDKLCLVVYLNNNNALSPPAETVLRERFVFEFTPLLDSVAGQAASTATVSLADLELHLRSFLVKIGCINHTPSKQQELRETAVLQANHFSKAAHGLAIRTEPWVPAEPELLRPDVIDVEPSLVPLKSVDTGLLKMQLYVENYAAST